ncbi:MAG: hypothetical protein ACYS8Z_24135 [Planctomycetota bacterium]
MTPSQPPAASWAVVTPPAFADWAGPEGANLLSWSIQSASINSRIESAKVAPSAEGGAERIERTTVVT